MVLDLHLVLRYRAHRSRLRARFRSSINGKLRWWWWCPRFIINLHGLSSSTRRSPDSDRNLDAYDPVAPRTRIGEERVLRIVLPFQTV